MKTCLSLVLAIFTFNLLYAQWEPTNGPVGGYIWDIKQNEDYMFASTEHGVYRSTDGGNSWTNLHVGPNPSKSSYKMGINGSILVVELLENSAPYSHTLFKSDDNGANWTQLNLPDTVGLAEIAVTDFAIYVMDTYDLLISTDNGQSWQNSTVNTQTAYPSGIASFNQEVYVGGYGKLYKSSANADTWTEYNISGMTASVDIIFVFEDVIFVRDYQYGDLHISTDGGQTWQKSNALDWGNGWTNFVKIGDAYYANHGGSVWKTLDLGFTWTEIPNNDYISFYKMVGYGNELVAGVFNRGILRSDNFGAAFHPSNLGLDASNVNALASINGKLLAGCDYIGLYQYDANSQSWDTTVHVPVKYQLPDVAGIGDKLFMINDYGQITRSDDNGLTWQDVTPGDPFGFNDFDKLTVDGNTLYTSGTGVNSGLNAPLFKTTDFGLTWEQVIIQVGGNSFTPVLFAKNTNYSFVAGFQTILRSADDGQTWEDISQTLVAVDPNYQIANLVVANNLVFIMVNSLDYSHLYVSYDNGNQWQLAETGITFQNFFGGVGQLIGVGGVLVATTLGQADGIFISLDNAQTWLPFNEGLGSLGGGKLVADGAYLYTAIYGQGVWRRSLSDLNLQPVSGKVYRDDNNNGIQDNGEPPMPGVILKLEDASSFAVSNSDGNYEIYSSFFAPDLLKVVTPNPYTLANPASYPVSQSGLGKDFGLYFPPGIEDLRVELTHFGVPRPGFTSNFGIVYKNIGTTVMSGSVNITLDQGIDYLDATPPPSQITGNVLTWDFSNLGLLESRFIKVNVKIPATTLVGTVLTSTAEILPSINDAAMIDNQDTERLTVVGSVDPNDKRVEPGEYLSFDQYSEGVPLTYTIRFQNTGTYQADIVRITDQLSQYLDVSSFQFLGSSHPCTYNIHGNGNIEFVFDMINLPDSTSNEAASHGFVKFSVLPVAGLSTGVSIQNTASIYFDFNAPIITNKVTTKIVETTAVAASPSLPTWKAVVFPNPNNGSFTVLFEGQNDNEPVELEVADTQGKVLLRQKAKTNRPTQIDMRQLATGIYFLRGKSDKVFYTSKILVD